MPITREEVNWLYRCLLGRPPETEQTIEFQMAIQPDFATARQAFIGSCEFQDRHMPPVYYKPEKAGSFERPKGLALAAIVKDEADNIEGMLQSVMPIVSYAVIIDTGSSDATKAIAEAALDAFGVPHTINEVPFENFAQARNSALAMVPLEMPWVLMLDADERLVPEDYPLFAELMKADLDAWGLPRYNFRDQDKEMPVQSYPDHQHRLLRNRRDNPVRYEASVHEDIYPRFRRAKAVCDTSRFGGTRGGPHIHHMGAAGDVETSRERSLFYADLAKREHDSADGGVRHPTGS